MAPKKLKIYMAPTTGAMPKSIQNGSFTFKFSGSPPWKVTPEVFEKIKEYMPGLVEQVSKSWKPAKP